MPEALEKWDLKLIDSVCPDIARIIIGIDKRQSEELSKGNFDKLNMQIIQDGTVNMAYLACYVCKYINGVAELHTKLLKERVLPHFLKSIPINFRIKQTELLNEGFFVFAILNTVLLLPNFWEVMSGLTIYPD